MAVREMWLNFPAKDVQKTKSFFKALGFAFNEDFPGADVWACMLVGKTKSVVMFMPENDFSKFSQHPVSNTQIASEILISIDAESKEEVNTVAALVEPNGGKLFSNPSEIDGWMYGFGFCDPEGHRWNMVYMDWANAKH